MTDEVINVPIHDEDVLNTVNLLPRTPKEARLIEVSLKRKLEYKTLINNNLLIQQNLENIRHTKSIRESLLSIL